MAYKPTGKRTPFQNPMGCYCLTSKTETSGNVTKAYKCWWYEGGVRKFKSFACKKYGKVWSKALAISHLMRMNKP